MKMNKKILSAAVLAALGTGSAQAVNLSENGLGQVLLFPYYTAQGNEETLITLVNTTSAGKAVKVRFREAYNSREVLDFNIYMSPYDVWTGKVTNQNGVAAVVSYDNTCTVPDLEPGVPIPFRTYNYDGSKKSTHPADGAPTGPERTLEGYVEVIEMGVPDDTATAVWDRNLPGGNDDGTPDYYHVNGVPQRCETVAENWVPGLWGDPTGVGGNPQLGFNKPAGGLFGSLAIINVQSGTEVAVAATALNNVYDEPQHSGFGSENPTLGGASPKVSEVVDDAGGAGNVVIKKAWWGRALNAVSSVLMARAVYNEYSINPAVEAETAWIVTFPTKWGYVDSPSIRPPFTSAMYSINVFTGEWIPEGKACEPVDAVAYDREEHTKTTGLDFSPLPPGGGFELCYEVNVLQFGQSDVFGAKNTVARLTNPPGDAGWLALGFTDTDQSLTSSDTDENGNTVPQYTFQGLPVIGFKATVLGNSNVGIGASYAAGVEHAYHRVVTP